MERITNFFSSDSNNAFNPLNPLNPLSDNDDGFNFGTYFQLSLKQRMYGFGICLAIGLLFSIVGILCLFFFNYVGFGVTYSLGNICVILSTIFLVGPMRQLKNMIQPHRAIATGVFILSIILTLLAALLWHNAFLCVLFLIFQVAAFIWYILSYIPYGRDMCCSCLKSVV